MSDLDHMVECPECGTPHPTNCNCGCRESQEFRKTIGQPDVPARTPDQMTDRDYAFDPESAGN